MKKNLLVIIIGVFFANAFFTNAAETRRIFITGDQGVANFFTVTCTIRNCAPYFCVVLPQLTFEEKLKFNNTSTIKKLFYQLLKKINSDECFGQIDNPNSSCYSPTGLMQVYFFDHFEKKVSEFFVNQDEIDRGDTCDLDVIYSKEFLSIPMFFYMKKNQIKVFSELLLCSSKFLENSINQEGYALNEKGSVVEMEWADYPGKTYSLRLMGKKNKFQEGFAWVKFGTAVALPLALEKMWNLTGDSWLLKAGLSVGTLAFVKFLVQTRSRATLAVDINKRYFKELDNRPYNHKCRFLLSNEDSARMNLYYYAKCMTVGAVVGFGGMTLARYVGYGLR